MNKKKLFNLLLLSLMLGVLLSSSVQADPLDVLKNVGTAVLDIGRLSFLGGAADSQLLGFIRIVMGFLVFTIIYMGISLGAKFISKNFAIAIAALLAIMTSIFIPGPVLLAIGATYGAIFSFILYGGLLIPGFWYVFVHPTETRQLAIVKLAILGLMTWIIAQVNSAALLISGGNFGGSIQNLGDFGKWINTITAYAWVIIIVMALWLLWKVIAPTGGVASGAWGLGEAGAKAVKKAGLVPFTKKHRERFGGDAFSIDKTAYRKSKRAFKIAIAKQILDENELKIVKDMKTKVTAINTAKNALAALPASPNPGTTTEVNQFKAFEKSIKPALKAIRNATSGWKKAGRGYPKHHKMIEEVLAEVEKNRKVKPADIATVRAEERELGVKHVDTKTKIDLITSALKRLEKAAKKATPNARTISIDSAKADIAAINFAPVVTAANNCVTYQNRVIVLLNGLQASLGPLVNK